MSVGKLNAELLATWSLVALGPVRSQMSLGGGGVDPRLPQGEARANCREGPGLFQGGENHGQVIRWGFEQSVHLKVHL